MPETQQPDLDAIRARMATVGAEWGAGWDGIEGCHFVTGPAPVPVGLNSPHGLSVWEGSDATFIAHAPTDIRALLAEVDRLRAELSA
jgi:hypothetical protein